MIAFVLGLAQASVRAIRQSESHQWHILLNVSCTQQVHETTSYDLRLLAWTYFEGRPIDSREFSVLLADDC